MPAYDLLFLNSAKWPKLTEESVVRKDTKLLIPQKPSVETVKAEAAATHRSWYVLPAGTSMAALATSMTFHDLPWPAHSA